MEMRRMTTQLPVAVDGSRTAVVRAAHSAANAYAGSLQRRYVGHQRTPDMLAELRMFYRLSLEAKLHHIAKAA